MMDSIFANIGNATTSVVNKLLDRIKELEAENARLTKLIDDSQKQDPKFWYVEGENVCLNMPFNVPDEKPLYPHPVIQDTEDMADITESLANQLHRAEEENARLTKLIDDSQNQERERLCEKIKAADDHCAHGDYMMDSDDCISVINGTWTQPCWDVTPAIAIRGSIVK